MLIVRRSIVACVAAHFCTYFVTSIALLEVLLLVPPPVQQHGIHQPRRDDADRRRLQHFGRGILAVHIKRGHASCATPGSISSHGCVDRGRVVYGRRMLRIAAGRSRALGARVWTRIRSPNLARRPNLLDRLRNHPPGRPTISPDWHAETHTNTIAGCDGTRGVGHPSSTASTTGTMRTNGTTRAISAETTATSPCGVAQSNHVCVTVSIECSSTACLWNRRAG